MAQGLRCLLMLPLCLAAFAACDAPARDDDTGAAMADTAVAVPAPSPLPAPVEDTIRQLREIAADGSYRDMARLADATPGFRSNTAGMSHSEYWYLKLRTGDWPMAQAERVLALPYAEANTPRGKIYIWPRLATLKPADITPFIADDIDDFLGEGHAEAIRAGAAWPGYVLAIAEDGTWLYFMSGEG